MQVSTVRPASAPATRFAKLSDSIEKEEAVYMVRTHRGKEGNAEYI